MSERCDHAWKPLRRDRSATVEICVRCASIRTMAHPVTVNEYHERAREADDEVVRICETFRDVDERIMEHRMTAVRLAALTRDPFKFAFFLGYARAMDRLAKWLNL